MKSQDDKCIEVINDFLKLENQKGNYNYLEDFNFGRLWQDDKYNNNEIYRKFRASYDEDSFYIVKCICYLIWNKHLPFMSNFAEMEEYYGGDTISPQKVLNNPSYYLTLGNFMLLPKKSFANITLNRYKYCCFRDDMFKMCNKFKEMFIFYDKGNWINKDKYNRTWKKIIEANKKVVVTSRGGSYRANNKGYIWPTSGRNITAYFNATGAHWSNKHTGLDIGIPTGSNIVASKGGTVIFSGWSGGYGYYVKIDHGNGVVTAYAHNSRLLVSVGDTVKQGDVIALSGSTGNSTGPHCHFEVIVNGSFKNPLNYL